MSSRCIKIFIRDQAEAPALHLPPEDDVSSGSGDAGPVGCDQAAASGVSVLGELGLVSAPSEIVLDGMNSLSPGVWVADPNQGDQQSAVSLHDRSQASDAEFSSDVGHLSFSFAGNAIQIGGEVNLEFPYLDVDRMSTPASCSSLSNELPLVAPGSIEWAKGDEALLASDIRMRAAGSWSLLLSMIFVMRAVVVAVVLLPELVYLLVVAYAFGGLSTVGVLTCIRLSLCPTCAIFEWSLFLMLSLGWCISFVLSDGLKNLCYLAENGKSEGRAGLCIYLALELGPVSSNWFYCCYRRCCKAFSDAVNAMPFCEAATMRSLEEASSSGGL
ncbi:hypothetical protein Nepgr_027213 [Nepenthes gracilis]|uniref:Transmembrane protein n=1 Tax=Nepenthes gracilis TaxID=150966 RepID=A0AAD3T882_NEPGR|nr:hypothetical protein Nepgr_027213 [Nepenthes gracilis]